MSSGSEAEYDSADTLDFTEIPPEKRHAFSAKYHWHFGRAIEQPPFCDYYRLLFVIWLREHCHFIADLVKVDSDGIRLIID